MILGPLAIISVGLFSLAGGLFDWDWFMTNSRARFVTTLLTRTGARVFYVLVGAGIVALGVAAGMSEPPAR